MEKKYKLKIVQKNFEVCIQKTTKSFFRIFHFFDIEVFETRHYIVKSLNT